MRIIQTWEQFNERKKMRHGSWNSETKEKYCQYCGSDDTDTKGKCVNCGAPEKGKTKYCKYCGKSTTTSKGKCDNCSAPLKDSEETIFGEKYGTRDTGPK